MAFGSPYIMQSRIDSIIASFILINTPIIPTDYACDPGLGKTALAAINAAEQAAHFNELAALYIRKPSALPIRHAPKLL